MPCDSSYMEPHREEIDLSRVYQLLDELDGGTIDKRAWEGYDKRVYDNSNNTTEQLDAKVAELCKRLEGVVDITKYSLELQMWWRDHQIADKRKRERMKTCKNCGQEILFEDSVWYHRDTDKIDCEPLTSAEPGEEEDDS